MSRRPLPPSLHTARVTGDRWLFGYADIVTLLLACFVSLYATGLAPAATPDPTPVAVAEPVADVAEPAADIDAPDGPEAIADVAVVDPGAAPPDDVERAFEDIAGDALSLPGVEMTTSARGLVISLPEAGSFPAGRADLSPSAQLVMRDLADRLRDLPNVIRVEGHTDDVPIATAQFASNWDLSTARATRVVAYLIEEGRIDPARLSAAGYAEHRPRLPNTTPESRARNRRVDIVVLDPDVADREEPGVDVR